MKPFVYVPYGGGTNSVAQLLLLNELGIIPDLILFADTGAEKRHTYNHIDLMEKWLCDHGFPPIIIVKSPNENLEENCFRRKQLPSIAYGYKTCSQRFKGDPQNKFINNYQPAQDYINAGKIIPHGPPNLINRKLARPETIYGNKILRLFGFESGEERRRKDSDKPHFENKYLLIEHGWDRDKCIQEIDKAGIKRPGKSSCYFCPNSKISEIKELGAKYPDLAKKAIALEDISRENNTMVKGLGRTWSWSDLLATDDMFGYDPIDNINCDCYDGD